MNDTNLLKTKKQMKKTTLLLLSLFLTVISYSQTVKKDSTIKQDTVITGHNTVVVLDSVQYNNLKLFLGSLPVSNTFAKYIYDLVNGENKNIFYIPIYGTKPKKK